MLYNLDELKKYSGGDTEFEIEILRTFLDEAPQFLTQLKSMLQSYKYPEARKLAHKYKSTIGILCMHELFKLIDTIENGVEKEIQNALPQIELLTNELTSQINLEIEKHINCK